MLDFCHNCGSYGGLFLPGSDTGSKATKPWTDAQVGRAYRNSPELHSDVVSIAAFKRLVRAIEAMQGIRQGEEG